MERLTRCTWFIGLIALAFALAGCGGGGGQSLTSTSDTGSGNVKFNVAWPQSKSTTVTVGSVDILMTANGVSVGETVVNAPVTSSNTLSLPASQVNYTVTTYSQPGKSGSIVSSAKGIMTVSANKLLTISVNTSPVISASDNLTISSPTNVFELRAGAQLALVATITDGQGNVVPLSSAYNLNWSTSDQTIATIDAQTGLVTGVKGGTVKITVTEMTTGITTYQYVVVDGLSARLFINGTQVADSSTASAATPCTYNGTLNTSLQCSVEGWYGTQSASQIQTCWVWGDGSAADPAQPTNMLPTTNTPPTVFRAGTSDQHVYTSAPATYYPCTVWISDQSGFVASVTVNVYLANNPCIMQSVVWAHPFDVTGISTSAPPAATPTISGWTWNAPLVSNVFTVPATTDVVFLALATASYGSNSTIPAGPNGEVLQGSVSWNFGDGVTTAFQPFVYREAYSIGMLVDPFLYGEGNQADQFEPNDTPAETDHTYTTPGQYTATATVMDNYGNASTTTYNVDITSQWPSTAAALKRR